MQFFDMIAISAPIPETVYDGGVGLTALAFAVLVIAAGLLLQGPLARFSNPFTRLRVWRSAAAQPALGVIR